jgi:dTDP-glucose pyrophosphorylase
MSLKKCHREEFSSRSSVAVDADWHVTKIIEKPKPEDILSPYAASVMFIFPPAIWDYISRAAPSPRGELELQTAVQAMIEDQYRAYGVPQAAPEEWDPIRHRIA